MPSNLSDKALAVFAFAAYHQLQSGQRVSSVVRRDGAGHSADAGGVRELEQRQLATATEDEITFTAAGEAALGRVLDAVRGAGG